MQERRQSTNSIMMIEPVAFNYNHETGIDNAFQHMANTSSAAEIAKKARHEMLSLRDQFLNAGVQVTNFIGSKNCPDDVFPNNWISTTPDKGLFLYPMATPSRRRERREDITNLLKDKYDFVFDLSRIERTGKSLEGTGVFVLDHLNKEAFVARSHRTDDELIKLWGRIADYTPVIFDTCDSNTGRPIYHTNVICHIGTGYAAVSLDMIVPTDRKKVLRQLERHNEVIILTSEQVKNFSGNALEVVGHDGMRHLALSERAYSALTEKQIEQYSQHVSGFIKAPIPTIEKHGGGSVRCMVCELF
ncbi:MAG: arginine deiminase-related protein [Alphaproteobacteria bacterium]|nr:arginine deiminase-related protein [Alphaproteobacteria bacterium]